MQEEMLEVVLAQASKGNDIEREKLIRHYKPYIINSAGRISGKYLTWSDEEASISLLAFNKAIDTYARDKGRTFLNYAYLLIKRDLVDYFKKEQRSGAHIALLTEEEETASAIEVASSLETYEKEKANTSLVEEILEFSEKLKQFAIEFEDLEKYTPKHQDTREKLLEIAYAFTQYQELIDEFQAKKRLPVKAFLRETGYSQKTIERYRNYLVTIILIQLHPEWRHLAAYIQIPLGSGRV